MSPSEVERCLYSLALPYRGEIKGTFHAAVGTCLMSRHRPTGLGCIVRSAKVDKIGQKY